MATFSSFQNHFLIDSFLLPNTNTSPSTINNNMCGLLEEPNNANNSFSQFCQPFEIETTNLDHSTNVSALSNNEPSSVFSITNKTTMNSSSIVTADKIHDNNTSDHVTPMKRNKRKCKQGSFANSAQSKDMREVKEKKQRKKKDGEIENKGKNEEKKGEKKAIEEPPTGYIHVRARRGQATDSHSLAERVRRERISERMKLLQALVPGCDKVTGKALMLDEIINYVQSLQHQVEFLSLKLASMNPIMSYDFGMGLDSFVVAPNQNLSSLPSPSPSPLPSMQQQCSLTPVNSYSIVDNPANSFLFQNDQVPNALPQGNRQVLWEVDDQRHKISHQSGFSDNNNLFSFH